MSVKEHVVHTIKCLITRSMLATRKLIDASKRRSCFELFGYDFIIDEDFNIWLIEVNTNPCIEVSSSILKVILPRMLDDMLKLSVDQLFTEFQPKVDPEKSEIPKYTFHMDKYQDDENMWEMLCNLKDKKSRKEAKAKYVQPIVLNSKYAFQVRDR